MNVLVSACLLGVNCRYCGTGCYHEQVALLNLKHRLIPVCPEQLGGLPTPRPPVELVNTRAVTQTGDDFTEQFIKGAEETVKLAKTLNCTHAVLKSRSPSCGRGSVYDGTFSGKLTDGNGITAEKLQHAGITVLSEDDLSELI